MFYVVILAGGSGTRFWPKSRKKRPKQLLNIVGPDSMLRQTVERSLPLAPFDRMLIVTGAEHEGQVKDVLPEFSEENILSEPIGRNTAPAIGLAALALAKKDPEAVMVVLPADHIIKKPDRLQEAIQKGLKILDRHSVLITLGIRPTRPETGYGYIEQGERFQEGVYRVQCFTEKPDEKTAREFLETGRFSWNSGMFLWKAGDILTAMQTCCPDLYNELKSIEEDLGTSRQQKAIQRVYERIKGDSIDYAVMEKAKEILVIPADLGWSDVGSWTALEDVLDKDENGNILMGNTVVWKTKNSILCSDKRLVTAIGVEDLIVVETDDALLVCRKDQAQEVRKIVDLLQVKGLDQYL